MTKTDFKLLATFLKDNPKKELAYAMIDFDNKCIIATDTTKLIKLHLQDDEIHKCIGVHYLHKSILKAIATMMDKDAIYRFEFNTIVANGARVQLDNRDDKADFNYPFTRSILFTTGMKSFDTNSLMFIDFDLTHENTHINSDFLKPLQEHLHADRYTVYTKPQTEDEAGRAKITSFITKDDKIHTRAEVVIMGIKYKPVQKSLFED